MARSIIQPYAQRHLTRWRMLGRPVRGLRVANAPNARLQVLSSIALVSLIASTVVGTIGAVIFVFMLAIVIAFEPFLAGKDLLRFFPMITMPAFAVISTLWSDAPQETLRASIELLITFISAIVMTRYLSPKILMGILFVGYLVINCLMLIDVPHAVINHVALYSRFLGSKNQVAFAAHMLIALSIAISVDIRQLPLVRLASIPAIVFASFILILAQSAGAVTSLAITIATLPLLLLSLRFQKSTRLFLFSIIIVTAFVALLFLPTILVKWVEFRTNVLGKDATLTGRTHLWEVASQLSAERPWLGHGYSAFWRQGNIDAEGLWRWGGIASRGGFNFHNAFVEMQVDLGYVGLWILVLNCVFIALCCIAWQLFRPSPLSAFLSSMLIVFYLRTYTEDGLVAPFSILTYLWTATVIYSFASLRADTGMKEFTREVASPSSAQKSFYRLRKNIAERR